MRSRNIKKICLVVAYSWLLYTFAAGVVSAQEEGGAPPSPALNSQGEKARLRAQLADALREYKASLERLVTMYESEAKRSEEVLAKIQELCAEGVAKRQEVETAAESFKRASERLAETKSQLKQAHI